jgi:hypothetical protein
MGGATKAIASKLYSKAGLGGILNTGFTLYAGYGTFKEQREQGSGFMSSALSAGGDMALSYMMGWKSYLGASLVPALAQMGVQTADTISQYSRNLERASRNRPFASTPTFVDTQQTYTMRQAGMKLAENSKYYVAKSFLGNEAQMITR